jgi:hypothetical protein
MSPEKEVVKNRLGKLELHGRIWFLPPLKLFFFYVFSRLSTIRTNMPIEEHRRVDIFGVENLQRKFFVGGAGDGRTWPFGPVRKNADSFNLIHDL